MHFELQAKTAAGFALICQQDKWVKQQQQQDNSFSFGNNFSYNKGQEPTSVLHMRRSQSPPTSASTLSYSFNGGAATGCDGVNFTDNTTTNTTEFQPISSELDLVTAPVGAQRCSLGLDEWETMLSESAVSPSQDNNSLLRWIGVDVDDHSYGLKQLLQSGNNTMGPNQGLDFECKAAGLGVVDQGSGFDPIGNLISSDPGNLGCFPGSGFMSNGNGVQSPMLTSPAEGIGLHVSLPMLYQQQQQQSQYLDTQEVKPQILHPQNPNFFMPFPQENHTLQQPLPKRLNHGSFEHGSQIPKLQFADAGHELFMRKQHHMGFPQQQHQQQATLLEQLYKVAEMVETGNFSHAQGILARLNHNQMSPVGKPFQRAAFYFKESMQLLLLMNNNNNNNNNLVSPQHPRNQTPFDVIFKMGAYKVFSEISPLVQFMNFTSNQVLLEALDDADRIHIVDFDIGVGAQWASFMQELPMRSKGAPSLRITAFASPSTHHPIELGLMRENLTHFANEVGICFELEVLNFDSLHMFRSYENEAIAVNFPIWSASNQPSIVPNLLRFVKQLRPKIVVSLDRGFDRNDLPFPQQIIHAFQSCTNLLESLDAAATVTSDVVNKIERFLLVPKIETTVLGRMHALERMPLWKTLLASAGFTPLTFSNFTEIQAECVVKRAQVRGFHVEKRHTSLVLCWQQRDLISASAWRC